MNYSRDDIRQRVQYLIEHGGIYPTERGAQWWARLAAGLAAASILADLGHWLL